LSDDSYIAPICPSSINWSVHFPNSNQKPTIADIGCGFGGLLIALSPHFKSECILGLEIRGRVVDIVREKIEDLREKWKLQVEGLNTQDGENGLNTLEMNEQNSNGENEKLLCNYQNISVVRTNIMKYCVNYFDKAQLSKMFILFADPHFKRSNYRRRVINHSYLSIYAYVLKVGGMLYTVTDVKDLYDWNVKHCDEHPLFQRVRNEELQNDICIDIMCNQTAEGQKVTRLNGQKYVAVYRRIQAYHT